MKISKLNDWTQLLAAVGVLAGIFLVAQELKPTSRMHSSSQLSNRIILRNRK